MEWNKLSDQKPKENEIVEIPFDGDKENFIFATYSEAGFWSCIDGYHEPEFWRPCIELQ